MKSSHETSCAWGIDIKGRWVGGWVGVGGNGGEMGGEDMDEEFTRNVLRLGNR